MPRMTMPGRVFHSRYIASTLSSGTPVRCWPMSTSISTLALQVWPSLRICSVSSPMAKNSTSGKAACSAAKRLMLGPTSGYARVRCFAPALAAISASAMVAHLKRSMPASICIWTTSAILWVLMWGHRRAAPPAMSIILRIFSRMIARVIDQLRAYDVLLTLKGIEVVVDLIHTPPASRSRPRCCPGRNWCPWQCGRADPSPRRTARTAGWSRR